MEYFPFHWIYFWLEIKAIQLHSKVKEIMKV